MLRNPVLLVLVSVMISCLIAASLVPANTTVYFEEGFQNDLEGWVINSYLVPRVCVGGEGYTCNYEEGPTYIEIVDGTLYIPNLRNSTHLSYNQALYQSTTMVGHWSFDMKLIPNSQTWVAITYDGRTDWVGFNATQPNGFSGYMLRLSSASSEVMLGHAYPHFTNVGDNASDSSEWIMAEEPWITAGIDPYITSTFRVDFTRQPDGNSTLWLKGIKMLSAIDNSITNSSYFGFASFQGGSNFDNITIDDNHQWDPSTDTTESTDTDITDTKTTESDTIDTETTESEVSLISPFILFALIVRQSISRRRFST